MVGSDIFWKGMGTGFSGEHSNRTDVRLGGIHLVETVELVELADLNLFLLVGIVMVDDHNLLIYSDGAVINLSHADASHIFIVVDGADQNLSPGLRVSLGSRNIVEDGLKQGNHVLSRPVHVKGCGSRPGGGEHEGTVKLLLAGIQLDEEFENLVDHLGGACLRAVDLVDAHDNGKLQLQSLSQHELGLRHGTLESVHNQNHAVHHLEDPLHLAAEVRMARGVDDVDLGAFVGDGSVFGEDGDTPFSLDVVGIHDPLRHVLMLAEHAALL